MILLTQSKLAPDLYVAASLDAATGGSETSMLTNVCEAASIMENWETVLPKAQHNLRNFDLPIAEELLEEKFKTLYQALRHGMSFDWVMNYVVAKCVEYFPFSYHFEFKNTQAFIDTHTGDAVFDAEMEKLQRLLDEVFDWVFLRYPDRFVYKRLAEFTGKQSLDAAINYLHRLSVEEAQGIEPFVFPSSTMSRVNYLIYFMDMISIGIGNIKRQVWTERFNQIKSGEQKEWVIVCGGKYNAFAYGYLDGSDKAVWKRLNEGIQYFGISERIQDTEYLRAFPDEMTFFRITEGLYIDETLFPKVSFDEGPWISTYAFRDAETEVPMDRVLRMRVKYDFPQSPDKPKLIKVKGGENCAIKDNLVMLDADGIGETQIVFRGNISSFTIVDSDKEYPFGVFRTKKIVVKHFEWLD